MAIKNHNDAGDEKEKTSTMFKILARIFSVQALGFGCGFLVHLILAKQLSPAEYGVYNFIFSASMLCALFGNFGFQASAVRLVPQMTSSAEAEDLKKFFGFSSIWILVLSSFLSLIVFYLISKFLPDDPYSRYALLVGIGLTPLMALIKLNSGMLKGFKKGAWALAYESSLKEIIFFIALSIAIIFSFIIDDAVTTLHVIFVVFGTLFIGSFIYVLKLIKAAKNNTEKQINASPSYKSWLVISFPMMLVISMQFLIMRADIIMLGFMVDAMQVGVYSAGAKLAQAATVTMMVLNIFFSPRASELFHKANYKGLRHLYFKTLKVQAVTTIILVALLAVVAPYIIDFLGVQYQGALPVIYMLLVGYAFNALWGPIPFLMIMTKYEYQAMWITFIAAILNIALNLIFIPIYGILGAALATIITLNLRNGCAFIYVVKTGVLSGKKNYE